VAVLQATVEHSLPKFDAAVKEIKAAGNAVLTLHQDAFAARFDDDEYTLLGIAIKYAGLYGVTLTVIGKDEEPLR
jgi:hypothetical protein